MVRHGVCGRCAAHGLLPHARMLRRRAAAAVSLRVRSRSVRPLAGDHSPRLEAVQYSREEDGAAKLLDFGIAKQLESLDEAADPTRTALRLMTPAYAAPEQLQGSRVGTRSDVYSGRYSLRIVGRAAPVRPVEYDACRGRTRHRAREPEKPSAVAAKHHGILRAGKAAWSDLDVLCLTAMHKDPERRYRSVEALIRDIDHYLKGEPLEAQSTLWHTGSANSSAGTGKAVAAAAIVFTVVGAQAAVFTIRLARARNAALAEAARTQRIQGFMLNLFEGGHQEAGPAENLRVIALLDRGVRRPETLNQDPRVQAELYQTLGGIYEKLEQIRPGRFSVAVRARPAEEDFRTG